MIFLSFKSESKHSERKSIWRIVPWEPIKHHDLIYVFGIITLRKLGAFEKKRKREKKWNKSESGEIKSTGNISSLFPQHLHSTLFYYNFFLFWYNFVSILFFCSFMLQDLIILFFFSSHSYCVVFMLLLLFSLSFVHICW